ncbi:MAG: cytochrome-c peroxidase [Cyanobacteria bacterium J06621_11]
MTKVKERQKEQRRRGAWGVAITSALLVGVGIISVWLSNTLLNPATILNPATKLSIRSQDFRSNASALVQAFEQVSNPALAQDEYPSEPIEPIPLSLSLNPQKVALGNRLFHDPQLSGDRTLSCASCHSNALGGADGLPTTISRDSGRRKGLNTPTVWNSAFNFRQRWDGGIASLEEQINGPLLSPTEMNNSWSEIVSRLSQDQNYLKAFHSLYPNGIQPDAVREAIATYERALITPNAKFDRYLKGDKSALSAQEKKGYDLFKRYGCVACHQGVNVGGNMFQRLGVMEDYFLARGDVQKIDLGRMNITGRTRDRYVFKVPSLRNIELTAPYLHDGSVETLEDSVRIMGKYQLGREIPNEDTAAIVSFLRTLTGTLPESVLADASETDKT